MREMMSRLKLTVNQVQDAGLRGAEGEFRLPGLHVRSAVVTKDRSPLPGGASVEETDCTDLCGRDASNRPAKYVPLHGRSGHRSEPYGIGLGELLQPGQRQSGLPDRGFPRRVQAEDVAPCQAPGPLRGEATLPHRSGSGPVWSDPPPRAARESPVGERMKSFSESRMRETCTSGSMSGTWKRSTAELVRHRQTKEPGTDRLRLNHRATSRLYLILRPLFSAPGYTCYGSFSGNCGTKYRRCSSYSHPGIFCRIPASVSSSMVGRPAQDPEERPAGLPHDGVTG